MVQGFLAVNSVPLQDEMIREYIDEQEGEQIADDSRFPIDNSYTPRLAAEGYLVRPDDIGMPKGSPSIPREIMRRSSVREFEPEEAIDNLRLLPRHC